MASPSGAPPAPTTTKKPITPEQKRLFTLLGVGGVLALLVGGRFVLGAMSGGGNTATNTAVAVNPAGNSAAPGGASETPPGGEAGTTPENPAGVPVSATASSGGTTPAALLPLARYRSDPFQPFVILPPPPTPAPPPPKPTPPPPVIPPPDIVSVPLANGNFPGSDGGAGGGTGGSGGGAAFNVPQLPNARPIDQPLRLPRVLIPRLNARNTSPTDAFPPPRSASGGGGDVTSPSFNKRLSGVVIGNGVRAILEINTGTGTKTYVVQPGDVVEGITVLSISRFNESGDQVTRMLIRENGGERYVDLKAGPPRTDAAGAGGAPGGP